MEEVIQFRKLLRSCWLLAGCFIHPSLTAVICLCSLSHHEKAFFFLHGTKKLKFRVGVKLCPIKGPTNCFSSSIFLTQMCVPLETNSSKFFCRKYFSGRLHFTPMNLCGFGVPRSGCRSHLKDPRAGGLPTLPTQKKSERQKSHFRTRRLPTPPVGT